MSVKQTSFYSRQKNYKQNCSVLSEQRLVLYTKTYLVMSERALHPVREEREGSFTHFINWCEVIKEEALT